MEPEKITGTAAYLKKVLETFFNGPIVKIAFRHQTEAWYEFEVLATSTTISSISAYGFSVETTGNPEDVSNCLHAMILNVLAELDAKGQYACAQALTGKGMEIFHSYLDEDDRVARSLIAAAETAVNNAAAGV